MVQMELVLINGIQYVHPDLVVSMVIVQLLIILYVMLTNVNLDMEIVVKMELVLINGIQYVQTIVDVTIINVQF